MHTDDEPLIAPAVTFGFTVSILEALAPPTVYVILVVPAATAVTNPEPELTVATEVFELLHDPPASPLLEYVAVCPIQMGDVPLTVPAFAALQGVMEKLTILVAQFP